MLLYHFDTLTEHGIKVIPLRKQSKVPLLKKWPEIWNKNVIRNIIKTKPDCNLGILLGDIIDVEGDTLGANQKIIDLIGSYPHPQYVSIKSIHHLFQNPDNITIFRHEDIEFRGYRHQSVLPPSVVNNSNYRWLGSVPLPIPPMPERLLAFYKSISKDLKPGHMALPCSLCGKKCFIHKKRFELEIIAFRELALQWQCHKCRKVDLRPKCRKLRRR